MNLLYNSISIWLFALILISIIVVGIYASINLKKKKPGHPYKYVLYAMFPAIFSILISRYLSESSSNEIVVSISTWVAIIFSILWFFVIAFSTYLANKKGFVSEKGKQILSSVFLPCAIIVIIGVGFLFYAWKFW